jgi:plastocyanin
VPVRKLFRSFVVALAFSVLAVGVLSAPASARQETDNHIRIRRFSFVQNLKLIFPGDLVSVENIDGQNVGIPHSLTSKIPGLFDTGVFTTGTRFINAPNAVGVYRYVCVVHPGMAGQLTVSPQGDRRT